MNENLSCEFRYKLNKNRGSWNQGIEDHGIKEIRWTFHCRKGPAPKDMKCSAMRVKAD